MEDIFFTPGTIVLVKDENKVDSAFLGIVMLPELTNDIKKKKHKAYKVTVFICNEIAIKNIKEIQVCCEFIVGEIDRRKETIDVVWEPPQGYQALLGIIAELGDENSNFSKKIIKEGIERKELANIKKTLELLGMYIFGNDELIRAVPYGDQFNRDIMGKFRLGIPITNI